MLPVDSASKETQGIDVVDVGKDEIVANKKLFSVVKQFNSPAMTTYASEDNSIAIKDLYDVEMEQVKKISYNNYVSYTFELIPSSGAEQDSLLLNLLVTVNPAGDVTKTVMLYDFTASQLARIKKGAPVHSPFKWGYFSADTPLHRFSHTSNVKGITYYNIGEGPDCPEGTTEFRTKPRTYEKNGVWHIVYYVLCIKFNNSGGGVQQMPRPEPAHPSSGGGSGTGGGGAGPSAGNPPIVVFPGDNDGPLLGGGGGEQDTPNLGDGGITTPIHIELKPSAAFYANLSPEEKDFWENNPDIASEISDFLNNGGDEAFAEQAYEVMLNDGDVDWKNKIVLDKTFLDSPKMKGIYEAFKSLSGTIFNEIVESHFGSSKTEFVRFQIKEQTSDFQNHKAHTYALHTTNSSENFFMIRFSPSFVEESSTIELALALIHELVHAELLSRDIKLGVIEAVYYDGSTSIGYFPAIIDSQNPFAQLLAFYSNGYSTNPEWTHHEFTLEGYRGEIASNLESIHPKLDDSNDKFEDYINSDALISSLSRFFELFSWNGLQNTDDYGNLPSDVKTKIQHAFNLADDHYNHSIPN